MEDALKEQLREKAADGKISCELAWRIAEELGVSKADVGRAADEAGIRIKDCQLGCF